ncbi:MAG: TadE family protein [Novosphingobium sp.]
MASQHGSTAVEFALVAPVLIMFLIGGMYLSMLGFTASSLRFAVQAGARCASINTTSCSNATSIQSYASQQFINVTGNAATFTATTPTCGNQVVASVNFPLLTGISRITVPLSASACFP